MRKRLWAREADRLSCIQLLEYNPVGSQWNELLNRFRESLRGPRRLIFIEGGYGAGKTLLLRKLIVEYSYIYPRIAPLYVPLRNQYMLVGTHNAYDILTNSIDMLLERAEKSPTEEASECLDEDVVNALRDTQTILADETKKNPANNEETLNTILNTVERTLQKRYGLKLVIMLDGLEEIITYSTQESSLPATVTKELYTLLHTLTPPFHYASRNPKYTTITTSTYPIPKLIAELLKEPLQKPASPHIMHLAAHLASELAEALRQPLKALAQQASKTTIEASEREKLLHEYLATLRDLREQGEQALDPKTTQHVSIIKIGYTLNDYDKLAENICGELNNKPTNKHALLAYIAHTCHIPPRYYLEKAQELCTGGRLVLHKPIEQIIKWLREIRDNRLEKRAQLVETLMRLVEEFDRPILSIHDVNNTELIRHLRNKLLKTIYTTDLLERLQKVTNRKEEIAYIIEPKISTYLILGNGNKNDPSEPRYSIETQAKRQVIKTIKPEKEPRNDTTST